MPTISRVSHMLLLTLDPTSGEGSCPLLMTSERFPDATLDQATLPFFGQTPGQMTD